MFRKRVGASVVPSRRTGGSSTLDSLNYSLASSSIVVETSNYWNVVQGAAPGEIEKDDDSDE